MIESIEHRVDAAASGAHNMRIDRELWHQCEKGERRSPFLRVYAWEPACLSLGYHQRLPEDVADRVAARGIDVVRRPTGGAAVLHAEEITYSITAPLDDGLFGRRISQIYDTIAESIVRALGDLGVECDRGGGGRPRGFACFSAAGGHEITVGGRKLVGSALRRGRHAFLQHGSLLTGPAHLEIAELMGDPRVAPALGARTVDLRELRATDRISPAAFADTLAAALAEAVVGA